MLLFKKEFFMLHPSWGIAFSGFFIGIAVVYALKIRLKRVSDESIGEGSGYQTIKKKAHLGDSDAQYHVGYLYEMGINSPLNSGKAFYWYCRSACSLHPGAIRKIAQCYFDGKGVEESLENGVWWMSPGEDDLKSQAAKKICRDIEIKYGKKPYGFMNDEEFKGRE